MATDLEDSVYDYSETNFESLYERFKNRLYAESAIRIEQNNLNTKETASKSVSENSVRDSIKDEILDRNESLKTITISRDALSPELNLDEEPYCTIHSGTLKQLKLSTQKLLQLLDEIHYKTKTTDFRECLQHSNLSDNNEKDYKEKYPAPDLTELIGQKAINRLQNQTKLITKPISNAADDKCTVYQRLTRKCVCLNKNDYNDFVIHFNEENKFLTSTVGEIIKNIKIIKKFLYMGGDYTRNALKFLNEGFDNSSRSEKVEIISGCSHADICNVFEDQSIVVCCISLPCTHAVYGDKKTQYLAASFLHNTSQLEEGRRYLNYSTKITNDLKKILRKKASLIDYETLEIMESTLNLLHPPFNETNVYYTKPVLEGLGNNSLQALTQYREYMTLDEIFNYLELFNSMSKQEIGKRDLISKLPSMLKLFKEMLVEYDNSEMNIIITNLLSNLVKKTPTQMPVTDLNRHFDIWNFDANPNAQLKTMKSVTIQFPPPTFKKKKYKIKSRVNVALTSHKRFSGIRQKENPSESKMPKSRKFTESVLQNSIIVVPLE